MLRRKKDRDAVNTRYRSAFLLLALIMLLGLLITEYQLSLQSTSARTINIAGRQRMLSQRITKNALKIAYNEDTALAAEQLSESLDLFSTSHRALRFGSEELGIETTYGKNIERQYEEIEPVYTNIVNASTTIRDNALAEDNTLALTAASIVLLSEQEFLNRMNQIVFALDAESNRRQREFQYLVYIIYGLLLCSLGAIWVGIIRPTMKRATEIDSAKTEFVSLASHQLRTPTTSIQWYAQLLQEHSLPPESQELVNQIDASTKRMDRLIDSLLNVSNMELGSFQVKPIPANWGPVIAGAMDQLNTQIETKKHSVNISIDDTLPDAAVDKEMLEIIVVNLLQNAIRFTPEGGEIDVTFRSTGRNRELIISDNGVGIPKLQQERIFEKFFRADNAKSVDHDGMGIGLYLVHTLVHAAGGHVRFTSSSDGTTFYVTFPLYGMQPYAGKKKRVTSRAK